jgi:hypothetical protein
MIVVREAMLVAKIAERDHAYALPYDAISVVSENGQTPKWSTAMA